jgi:hypothetical protein
MRRRYDVRPRPVRVGSRHVMCLACARRSVGVMIGLDDVTTSTPLLCGCLTIGTIGALMDFVDAVGSAPQQPGCAPAPTRASVHAWISRRLDALLCPLLLPCSVASCGQCNWPLRDDVEKSRVPEKWRCAAGHDYNVRPSPRGVSAANTELQAEDAVAKHNCTHDATMVPQCRACPRCLLGGVVILCVHTGGCKRFPGEEADRAKTGTHCMHVFCFRCLKDWSSCGHGKECENPGTQLLSVKDGRLQCAWAAPAPRDIPRPEAPVPVVAAVAVEAGGEACGGADGEAGGEAGGEPAAQGGN